MQWKWAESTKGHFHMALTPLVEIIGQNHPRNQKNQTKQQPKKYESINIDVSDSNKEHQQKIQQPNDGKINWNEVDQEEGMWRPSEAYLSVKRLVISAVL